MSRRGKTRHHGDDGCLAFAVALQDHFSRTLQLPGGPKRMPTQLPGAQLTLAQRRGLILKPDKLLSQEEWSAVHSLARQRDDCSASNCAICLEPFKAEQQVLLSCSHVFHQQCLASFERHVRVKACPLCRKAWYQQLIISDAAEAYRHTCATRIQAAVRGWLCRKSLSRLLQDAPQAHGLKRTWAAGQLSTVRQALTGLVQDAADDLDQLFAELDASLAVSRGMADPLQLREQAAAAAAAAVSRNSEAAGGAAVARQAGAGGVEPQLQQQTQQQQSGRRSSKRTLAISRSSNSSRHAQPAAAVNRQHRAGSQQHHTAQQQPRRVAPATAAGAAAIERANRAQQAHAAVAAQAAAPASSAHHAGAASEAVAVDWEQTTQLLSSRSFSSDEKDDKGKKDGNIIQGIFSSWTKKGDSSSSAAGSGSDGGKDEAAGMLMPNSPEHKHRKMFVVELSRKPLFPGIYTPVLVHNNAQLIKEVQEQRRQGGQAYVAAFLGKSEKALAEEAASKQQDGQPAAAGDGEAAAAAGSSSSSSGMDHLHEVGTFAQVHTILPGDSTDSAQLLLLGHRRLKREAVLSSDPLRVAVSHLRDESYVNDDITKATSMELVNTMKDLLNMNPLYGEQFRTLMSLTGSIDLNDLSRLVDAAASLTSADDVTLQGVLEQLAVPARAKMVLELLKKEVELCKLQQDIREQVEAKIMKEQRRMILMEQLKSIKRELGLEKDDKATLIGNFTAKWEPKKAAAPEEVRKVVSDELDKLSGLEPVSPEFNVTRTYLEWLTSLPWGEYSKEVFDIGHAQQVLDEDHFGLQDVKARILEFIAVSRLRGSAQGKILCLVGPPGVGKTSIGRSIARTLGRKYYRFSVGGLYDVAEIKGHRRTYVGAMPGKMVQCLKSTGSSNPLVLIDEIDKLGRGHTGDPASALLELLDPEQNSGFLDHYLDVPIDLSKVLFVCTANVLDTIPGPLLDRMEVIRLSGYTSDEKRSIARRYLEPQALTDSGVPSDAVALTDPAMDNLIDEYCREAGVRNLKKHLEKIYRKAAFKLVQGGAKLVALEPPAAAAAAAAAADADADASAADKQQQEQGQEAAAADAGAASADSSSSSSSSSDTAAESSSSSSSGTTLQVVYKGDPISIGDGDLKEYVGLPPFAQDKFYDTTPAGVVMGLAWTAMGGATLYVEAAPIIDGSGDGKGSGGRLVTTGQLGDVMRESASIAHTYARAFLHNRDPSSAGFFDKTSVHVHVPAGATPKDGPSAGCTIITSLLSLALGRPVAPGLAMTGEVSLTGKVLPIGGVKEKLLAARRSGVTDVIFPVGNRREYEDVPEDLKAGIAPHFVDSYEQIFTLAFPDSSSSSSQQAEGSSS
uniref:Lon protease homolog n=1 Tax=Tetradesmus obliquus TaxID=3088 RepID=A0A383VUK5_TETOB|eukprot:jgi/Sobl393_1/2464/SZX68086.1